ncbi:Protein of unknown function, partial [Gryllus bimaculatus]
TAKRSARPASEGETAAAAPPPALRGVLLPRDAGCRAPPLPAAADPLTAALSLAVVWKLKSIASSGEDKRQLRVKSLTLSSSSLKSQSYCSLFCLDCQTIKTDLLAEEAEKVAGLTEKTVWSSPSDEDIEDFFMADAPAPLDHREETPAPTSSSSPSPSARPRPFPGLRRRPGAVRRRGRLRSQRPPSTAPLRLPPELAAKLDVTCLSAQRRGGAFLKAPEVPHSAVRYTRE